MPAVSWEVRHFCELQSKTLYELLALRSQVFVVEQSCVFLDLDGLDLHAFQVTGRIGDDLIACARILPAPVLEPGFASIGRVAVAQQWRHRGYGRSLMREALGALGQLGNRWPIKIIAQHYLEGFYRGFGFEPVGSVFLQEGQPHIAMVKH